MTCADPTHVSDADLVRNDLAVFANVAGVQEAIRNGLLSMEHGVEKIRKLLCPPKRRRQPKTAPTIRLVEPAVLLPYRKPWYTPGASWTR